MLCIVSVYRPDLLEEAVHAIATMGVAAHVEVFVDRRIGERRNPERANSEASRVADRRRVDIEEQLRQEGVAIVPLG